MARKYSGQLVVESAIVAALLIAIASGGVASRMNILAWQNLQNHVSYWSIVRSVDPESNIGTLGRENVIDVFKRWIR